MYTEIYLCYGFILSLFSINKFTEKRRILIISRLHGKQSMLSDGGVMMTRFFINGLINLVSLAVCLQVQILGAQGIAQQLLRVL